MNDNVSKFLDYQGTFAIYNLTEAVKYALLMNQDDDIVEKILKLSGMEKITTDSFIENLKRANTLDSALQLNVMKRAPSELSDSIITWIYYSIYWAMLDGMASDKKINNRKNKIISRIALEFHYCYLLYVNTYEVEDRISVKDIEYSANMITRVIEFLSYIGKQKNTYLTEVYFDENVDDYLSHCISTLVDDYIESDCYFIRRDPRTKEVFFKYENDDEGIHFQVLPSRKIHVGTTNKNKDSGQSEKNENQKVKQYLLDGLSRYHKIINMVPGGRGKKKNESFQEISTKAQITQLEVLQKNNKSDVNQNKKSETRERPALASDDVNIIPDQNKQRHINMAFSAKNTKRNLLLQSAYDVPQIDNMLIFIKHLCNKKFEEVFLLDDLFVFIFLMGITTGMNYQEVIELLLNGKTKYYLIDSEKNTLKVTLHKQLFGGEYNDLSTSSIKYITFELPRALVSLYSNVHNTISILVSEVQSSLASYETQYIKFMKEKIDSCPTMISIDINNLWKIILTYQAKHKNISSLFCIGKYTTQIRSTLSYGSAHKFGQVHSVFLKDFCNQLNMDDCINSLVPVPLCDIQERTQHDSKAEFCGSNRVVSQEDIKKFFSLLRRELLKENDSVRYLNLYALYARYALGLLMATRHLSASCKLDKISYELEFLTITEKGDTKASGTRVIPLTKKAKQIIQRYKSLATRMNIRTDNIYFILNGKPRGFNNVNRKLMSGLLLEYEVNPFIIDFVESVWLNFGRHVLTKVAMEKNFNFTYLQALLGHFSKGCEQHGIVSVLDEREWHRQCVKLFDHIGALYGI